MLYLRRMAARLLMPSQASANEVRVFKGDKAAPTAGAVAATAPITLGTTTVSPHALKKAVSKSSTPAESAFAAYRYCTQPTGHAPMTHTCGSLTHSNTPVDHLRGGRSEDSTAEYVACCAIQI